MLAKRKTMKSSGLCPRNLLLGLRLYLIERSFNRPNS